MDRDPNPTWTRWGEVPSVVLYRPYLKRTLATAAIVGTILFAINQLDLVLLGRADWKVWLKGLVTYFVPFCVTNWGILTASKRMPTGESRTAVRREPG